MLGMLSRQHLGQVLSLVGNFVWASWRGIGSPCWINSWSEAEGWADFVGQLRCWTEWADKKAGSSCKQLWAVTPTRPTSPI